MYRSCADTRLFSTPFSAEYWRCAMDEMRNLRMLLLAALFIGVKIVISSFFIPVGDNLQIHFSFFIYSIGGMIYGPVVGLTSGFVGDILSFFIHPSGIFFPGYTLSEMLGCLIYGLFFYRTKITVTKIFFCKFSINFFINIGLGTLWSTILYSKGYLYYLAKSVVKNTLLLPIEVILLVLLFQMMLPVLSKHELIPQRQTGRLPLF